LTGELPFRGSKAMMLYQVLHEDPKPPRQLNAKVPRDLETVCLKCLHKEPHKRYASARELADDLKRFLAGEAVGARREGGAARGRGGGRRERAWRWCRRNPAVAGLLAVVALLLVSGTVVSTLFALDAAEQARVARDKAEDADTQRRNAEASARKAGAAESRATEKAELERRRAYGVGMLLTQAAWEQHQVDRFLQLLEENRPGKAGDEDF